MRVVFGVAGGQRGRVVGKLRCPLKTRAAEASRHCRIEHRCRHIGRIKFINHPRFTGASRHMFKWIVILRHRAQHVALQAAEFQQASRVPLERHAVDIAFTQCFGKFRPVALFTAVVKQRFSHTGVAHHFDQVVDVTGNCTGVRVFRLVK